jgi:hypothetical protein
MVFQFVVEEVLIVAAAGLASVDPASVDPAFVDLAFVDPASLAPAFVDPVVDVLAHVDDEIHHSPHRYHLLMTQAATGTPTRRSQDEEILRSTVDYAMAFHKAHIL